MIGPNGAGKTTMMDVITGKTGPRNANVSGPRLPRAKHRPDAHDRAAGSRRPGLAASSRSPPCSSSTSVWENLELAMKGDKRWSSSLRARLGAQGPSPHRGNAGVRRGWKMKRIARPACCRTGRSSGWRSACC
ncbi:ATP-binding cassette domain-containing protein [Cupriavidus basilensis]